MSIHGLADPPGGLYTPVPGNITSPLTICTTARAATAMSHHNDDACARAHFARLAVRRRQLTRSWHNHQGHELFGARMSCSCGARRHRKLHAFTLLTLEPFLSPRSWPSSALAFSDGRWRSSSLYCSAWLALCAVCLYLKLSLFCAVGAGYRCWWLTLFVAVWSVTGVGHIGR